MPQLPRTDPHTALLWRAFHSPHGIAVRSFNLANDRSLFGIARRCEPLFSDLIVETSPDFPETELWLRRAPLP